MQAVVEGEAVRELVVVAGEAPVASDPLETLGDAEIPSTRIGELVMDALQGLDSVAYIRFASVYRSFKDVDDFRDAIREVEPPPKKPRKKRDA